MTDPIPAVEALREAIRLLLRDFDRDPTDDYLDLAVPKFQQRLTPAQPVTETTDLRSALVSIVRRNERRMDPDAEPVLSDDREVVLYATAGDFRAIRAALDAATPDNQGADR